MILFDGNLLATTTLSLRPLYDFAEKVGIDRSQFIPSITQPRYIVSKDKVDEVLKYAPKEVTVQRPHSLDIYM
jgi:hypothetical protein